MLCKKVLITSVVGVMFCLGCNPERANIELTNNRLEALKSAIIQYQAKYEKEIDYLDDLINTPDGKPLIESEENFKDAWGNGYQRMSSWSLDHDDKENKDVVINTTITSNGPDGKGGNEDDISIEFGATVPKRIIQIKETKSWLDDLKSACRDYHFRYEKDPDSLDDLIKTPDGEPLPLIDEEKLKDAWGNSYIFQNSNSNKTIITSKGPDGEGGNEDDISIEF